MLEPSPNVFVNISQVALELAKNGHNVSMVTKKKKKKKKERKKERILLSMIEYFHISLICFFCLLFRDIILLLSEFKFLSYIWHEYEIVASICIC